MNPTMHHIIAAIAPESPEGILDTARQIAHQSDRVLFIISLGLLLGAAWWMIRRFMAQLDKKDQQLEALVKSNQESHHELAKSIDKLAGNVGDNTQILRKLEAKHMLAVLAICFTLLPGCAKFSGYTDRKLPDGTVEHVHFRGYTLFDGQAKLAQGKALLGKTASVGVQGSELESTSEALTKSIEALPAAIKAALIPTP